MNKIISPKNLVDFYKKGLFPMADNISSQIINFYEPNKRFLIPIKNFHIPKNGLNPDKNRHTKESKIPSNDVVNANLFII